MRRGHHGVKQRHRAGSRWGDGVCDRRVRRKGGGKRRGRSRPLGRAHRFCGSRQICVKGYRSVTHRPTARACICIAFRARNAPLRSSDSAQVEHKWETSGRNRPWARDEGSRHESSSQTAQLQVADPVSAFQWVKRQMARTLPPLLPLEPRVRTHGEILCLVSVDRRRRVPSLEKARSVRWKCVQAKRTLAGSRIRG